MDPEIPHCLEQTLDLRGRGFPTLTAWRDQQASSEIMDCGGLQNVSGLCINSVKCLCTDRLITQSIGFYRFSRVGWIYRGYAGRSVVWGSSSQKQLAEAEALQLSDGYLNLPKVNNRILVSQYGQKRDEIGRAHV